MCTKHVWYTFEHAIFQTWADMCKFYFCVLFITIFAYMESSLNANFIYMVGKWLKLMKPQDPLNRWKVVDAQKCEL